MKVTVNISIGDRTYSVIQEIKDSWKLAENPSTFRKGNPKALDEVSKLLENIGLVVMKHRFPDINKFFYHAYFHPMLTHKTLKNI